MKKTLFAVAALLCGVQFANAQIEKGTQNLGLNLNISNQKVNSSSVNAGSAFTSKTVADNFLIGPSYGYFICDGTELGASLSYMTGTNTGNGQVTFPGGVTNSENKTNSKLYGGVIYLRKYVLYQNKIGFRTGPYAGYSWGSSTSTTTPGLATDGKNNDKLFNVGANLDLVFYPSNKLGVALNLANLGYSKFTSKGTRMDQVDTQNFGFNFINSNVGVSVYYVIGKK